MQLFVTILEETAEQAIRTIRTLTADHDGIEVRAESLPALDLGALRAATAKPIILTHRGRNVDGATIELAVGAGIDFVDVEFREGMDRAAVERHRERVVLSHHDFDGMESVETIAGSMDAFRCAHVKVAVTPHDFASNLRLLRLGGPRRSVIGMGERGLYARILAPFRGSELAFAAVSQAAAPGQLTLQSAVEIYGANRSALRADRVFAVAGNPAGHSLSPAIHNALFREKGVSAAYTIASAERFAELEEPFLRGEPVGLSVTAPFKEDAFRFADRIGADIGANALAATAVNTLVTTRDGVVADNTDVDGFETLLAHAGEVRLAAIAGAGATARAAAVALQRAGIAAVSFNRTAGRADRPLAELAQFEGDLVIDTLPASAQAPMPQRHGLRVIRAAYGAAAWPVSGDVSVIDGLQLLHAQAVRQHQLFMRAFA